MINRDILNRDNFIDILGGNHFGRILWAKSSDYLKRSEDAWRPRRRKKMKRNPVLKTWMSPKGCCWDIIHALTKAGEMPSTSTFKAKSTDSTTLYEKNYFEAPFLVLQVVTNRGL